MESYGQFCAVARGLEVIGERWTLLVVRELLCGATTFGEIRSGLPRIPKATLADRLRSLVAAGLVDRDDGYRLTTAGAGLAPVMAEIARWAATSAAAELSPEHLDPVALTWDLQRRVDRDALPDRKVVIELTFTDRDPSDRRFWLHLSPRRVDLCRTDTGDPVDVWLAGPTDVITRWWLGEVPWRQTVRSGVEVTGPRALRTALPTWFLGYAFAGATVGGATARRPVRSGS